MGNVWLSCWISDETIWGEEESAYADLCLQELWKDPELRRSPRMQFPYFSVWVTKADRGEGQVTAGQPLWGWGVGGAAGWSCCCMVGVAVGTQHSPSAFLPATITGYSGPLIHASKRQIHFAPAITARTGRMGSWEPGESAPGDVSSLTSPLYLSNMIKQTLQAFNNRNKTV